MDLEEVWRIREEDVYPHLFGCRGRGIFPLTKELFSTRFRGHAADPRWLFEGAFEFAPTAGRSFWLYVTSGYSNPWHDEPEAYDPNGLSGSGAEFLFATVEPGDWAIRFLQNMLAFDLLLSAGKFPNRGPLVPGDRIPLNAPINGLDTCEIRNVVVTGADLFPDGFSLPSGKVDFLAFTGATDNEIAYAKAHDSDALIRLLSAAGQHPVTNPARKSAL